MPRGKITDEVGLGGDQTLTNPEMMKTLFSDAFETLHICCFSHFNKLRWPGTKYNYISFM